MSPVHFHKSQIGFLPKLYETATLQNRVIVLESKVIFIQNNIIVSVLKQKYNVESHKIAVFKLKIE